jgi:hypothetical protein
MLLKTSIVDFVCCRRSTSMVLGGDVIALSRNKRETVEGVEASQSTSHEEREIPVPGTLRHKMTSKPCIEDVLGPGLRVRSLLTRTCRV